MALFVLAVGSKGTTIGIAEADIAKVEVDRTSSTSPEVINAIAGCAAGADNSDDEDNEETNNEDGIDDGTALVLSSRRATGKRLYIFSDLNEKKLWLFPYYYFDIIITWFYINIHSYFVFYYEFTSRHL